MWIRKQSQRKTKYQVSCDCVTSQKHNYAFLVFFFVGGGGACHYPTRITYYASKNPLNLWNSKIFFVTLEIVMTTIYKAFQVVLSFTFIYKRHSHFSLHIFGILFHEENVSKLHRHYFWQRKINLTLICHLDKGLSVWA